MIPAVLITQFVYEYISTIPIIKFQSIESLKQQFIDSCIDKYNLVRYKNLISQMVPAMDNPNQPIIEHNELSNFNICENRVNTDWIQYFDTISNGSKISANSLKQILIYTNHNEELSWIEAIYCGFHLVDAIIQLKVLKLDKDEALDAFARLNSIDNDSDNSSEDSFVEI